MEYELRWEYMEDKPGENQVLTGKMVTSKTFDSLDKARKYAAMKISPTVCCGGCAAITIYGDKQKIGEVYGDGDYCEGLGEGIMWVEVGQGYESNLVPGISISTGKINKKLYRLT